MFGIALLLLTLSLVANDLLADDDANGLRIYVATYSPVDGEGIFVADVNAKQGTIGPLRATGQLKSPAALAVHPTGQYVYATMLITDSQGAAVGGIAAFAVDRKTGELTEIDRRPSAGTGPCYLACDPRGISLVVANCGTATVAALSIGPDGRFDEFSSVIQHTGESKNSEGKPQAHSIVVSPGGKFALAADLGLDRLFIYKLNAEKGALTPHDHPSCLLEQGAGPRHIVFHPTGKFAFAIGELGNTITACTFDDETGDLRVLHEVSTLSNDYRGESYAADIQVHPNGKFLYGSNRGEDTLAICAIDDQTGRIKSLSQVSCGGKFPRAIAIDPSGRLLIMANQKSDHLMLFRIDPATGKLNQIGAPVTIPQPVAVRLCTYRSPK
ncbi:MAG: lactonase family protein [Planctomycetota bacterium]|nr:lactonase family protein [Planctomycetota bacterium]